MIPGKRKFSYSFSSLMRRKITTCRKTTLALYVISYRKRANVTTSLDYLEVVTVANIWSSLPLNYELLTLVEDEVVVWLRAGFKHLEVVEWLHAAVLAFNNFLIFLMKYVILYMVAKKYKKGESRLQQTWTHLGHFEWFWLSYDNAINETNVCVKCISSGP